MVVNKLFVALIMVNNTNNTLKLPLQNIHIKSNGILQHLQFILRTKLIFMKINNIYYLI